MRSFGRMLGWVLAGMGLLGAGCASVLAPATTRFSDSHTAAFDVLREPPYGWGPSGLDALDKVQRAAAQGLDERGYELRMLSEPSDLLVTIEVGRRWSRAPASIARTHWWNHGPPEFTGAFVVAAYDRATGALLWRQWTRTGVDLDRIDHDALASAMESALESFPRFTRPAALVGVLGR